MARKYKAAIRAAFLKELITMFAFLKSKFNLITLAVFFVLFISSLLYSDSFYGTIGSYPVWVNIDGISKDGEIHGCYFIKPWVLIFALMA
jgi:hypothetical protein